MPYHGTVPLPLTRSRLTVLLDDGRSWWRSVVVNPPLRTRDAWMRVIAGLVGVALAAVATSLGATIYGGMLVLVVLLRHCNRHSKDRGSHPGGHRSSHERSSCIR